MNTKCQKCKKDIKTTKYKISIGKSKFCSPKCSYIGNKNRLKNNGRSRNVDGYIRIRDVTHPKAQSGYILEHVAVVEKHLGRSLKRPEQVHHINGIKDDNRIENLKLCKNSEEHIRYES